MTSFFSSIGSGVLDLFVFCLCVAVTAGLSGILLSLTAELSLKGKSDVNQDAAGGFLSGIIIGGVVSFFLTAYLLFATDLHATVMVTLGICGCLAVASIGLTYLNWKLMVSARRNQA
jgi:hypothetical protein